VEEWQVVAIVGLRLLKTGPSAESSSDSISTTPLSSSRGGGAGDAWATTRGTATIGVEGVGEGAAAEVPEPQMPLCSEQGRQPAWPASPHSTPYLYQNSEYKMLESNP